MTPSATTQHSPRTHRTFSRDSRIGYRQESERTPRKPVTLCALNNPEVPPDHSFLADDALFERAHEPVLEVPLELLPVIANVDGRGRCFACCRAVRYDPKLEIEPHLR